MDAQSRRVLGLVFIALGGGLEYIFEFPETALKARFSGTFHIRDA
jgi:hypothetical protein